MIYTPLPCFLQTSSFSNPPHGFGTHLFCETQLLLFTNHLFIHFDAGYRTTTAVLEFDKSFDKVSHKLLLRKLSTSNTDPNLLTWIESFLSQHRSCICTNDTASSLYPVTSGVSQIIGLRPLFL